MAFIKKEEGGFIKGEPGGGFDMSRIPMAPPKAKIEQEGKRNLAALPEFKGTLSQNKTPLSEYKPPNGGGRRNRRHRGGSHIPHSIGNFRIRTVYNRHREEVTMTVSTIEPTTQLGWEREHSAVDWDSVERIIFEKLRRARFQIEPIPSDAGKLGPSISDAFVHNAPQDYGLRPPVGGHSKIIITSSRSVSTEVLFNVRPLGNLASSIPLRSWVNDHKPSPGSTTKSEPVVFGQDRIVKSEPFVFGNSLLSTQSQESRLSSDTDLFGPVTDRPHVP
ncbi:hypothetical protein QBC40DRAFT_262950 [Triangularia verruculosa]|uniref:Uncharacterized protein n=1 Tax=Triangularia verruculosa TaxID=2587418 RepID=A0AAN7AX88_9PEZI|nr:hypothetical protein QBC40DRAFT_262950 [Triangularia verruculosa]